ncbi:MAG: peptidase SpoIVB [Firmicutes bacterium]|nr:peptidase SpoIVB [Bacillota bacterium]
MSLLFRICRTAFLAFLFLMQLSLVQAAPNIMPLEQVKAGMHGIGKTVVSGTAIEEFNVEVLGVMKNQGPSGDLILVRTSGDVINRTGGIAQGMSGSPVYINGKLVGAISYGWALSDHKLGMVTPIADMLKLWDLPNGTPQEKAGVDPEPKELRSQATPLMAAGFSERAMEMLKTKLAPANLVPVAVGSAPSGANFGPLKPGSAVGVELVHGDVSLAAIGTVTYTEGNKVLAFGHPFMKKGLSNYLLSNAYVFTTVNSIENSFKVGSTGQVLGVVNQDRGAGIAGDLSSEPRVIPLRVTVTDIGLAKSRVFNAVMIKDEQLTPTLGSVTAFNAIEKTVDRSGAGTAKVSFEVTSKSLPGGILKRENMFYSPENISELSVSEINESLSLLASNKLQAVDIDDIKVNVTVNAERRTATVMNARANVAEAKPGDQIEITVNLMPYRGKAFERKMYFTVPKNQPAGPMTLEVRGGGSIPMVALLAKRQNAEGELLQLADKLKNQTLPDMIKQLTARDHNNDLVVEILDGDLNVLPKEDQAAKPTQPKVDSIKPIPTDASKLKGQSPSYSVGGSSGEAVKSVLSIDYVIDSDAQVVVNVKGNAKPASKGGKGVISREKGRSSWH